MGQKLHFFFLFFFGTTSGHALYTAGQSLNLKILRQSISYNRQFLSPDLAELFENKTLIDIPIHFQMN